ncbi:MAG: ribonuclease Y [Candidatus Margulisiibacteriota bacterium]
MSVINIVFGLIGLGIGFGAYAVYRKFIAEKSVTSAEATSKKLIIDAEKEAEEKKRQGMMELKDEAIRMRKEFEEETKERRTEISAIEKRLMQKEERLENKETTLDTKEKEIEGRSNELQKQKMRVDNMYQQQVQALEKISALSREDAKKMLLSTIEREIKSDAANMIRSIEAQAKQTADKRAREIVAGAIQRSAVDNVVEMTTSTVILPSDEMKGRIIGREGRNIRAFEMMTGVDLMVDDTPETVILSCFDPIRRAVAKIALTHLIKDGRIHPSRVEEMVKKAQKEVAAIIKEEGERVALELDVQGLHPNLIEMIGRLRYRTSYGQNGLLHSIEVCHLCDFMAQELGVNNRLAKRAGLLHDIGKAVDFEQEGTHVEIGVTLAKKYGESPEVIHAIAAHHEDIEAQTIEAIIVAAADAISASRPGARRESFEAYIKRLEKLEGLASSFEGVEKSYAIQAGREVRVIVKPGEINDEGSVLLARSIVKKIEHELEYPGQIKVTVLRELRATEIAK